MHSEASTVLKISFTYFKNELKLSLILLSVIVKKCVRGNHLFLTAFQLRQGRDLGMFSFIFFPPFMQPSVKEEETVEKENLHYLQAIPFFSKTD